MLVWECSAASVLGTAYISSPQSRGVTKNTGRSCGEKDMMILASMGAAELDVSLLLWMQVPLVGRETIVGPGPAPPSLMSTDTGSHIVRAGHKRYFFDLGSNNKGQYLRITEVCIPVPTVSLKMHTILARSADWQHLQQFSSLACLSLCAQLSSPSNCDVATLASHICSPGISGFLYSLSQAHTWHCAILCSMRSESEFGM